MTAISTASDIGWKAHRAARQRGGQCWPAWEPGMRGSRCSRRSAAAAGRSSRSRRSVLHRRPVSEMSEFRLLATEIARMEAPDSQARALNALARQPVPDRESVVVLAELFPLAKSLEVQRAIAGVLLRFGLRLAAGDESRQDAERAPFAFARWTRCHRHPDPATGGPSVASGRTGRGGRLQVTAEGRVRGRVPGMPRASRRCSMSNMRVAGGTGCGCSTRMCR